MQSDIKTAYLLLGSNLGDRENYLSEALSSLTADVGTILQISSIYETAAWGKTDQPSFLNLAVEMETALNPSQLLEAVLKIEADLGRERLERWGARLIDIDIILFGHDVVNVIGKLQIPHPEMQNRRFVLLPLSEIAKNVVHPVLKKKISELLSNLDDNLTVVKR